MITRRKLLTFLGLGGAAAAVASKAEALALPATATPVEPTMLMCRPEVAAKARELLAKRTATVINVRTLVADERAGEKIATALESAHRDYLAANEGEARAFYDDVAFFTRDEGEDKPPSLALGSTKPVGEGWVRIKPGATLLPCGCGLVCTGHAPWSKR